MNLFCINLAHQPRQLSVYFTPNSVSWLAQFNGTPLFTQALLETMLPDFTSNFYRKYNNKVPNCNTKTNQFPEAKTYADVATTSANKSMHVISNNRPHWTQYQLKDKDIHSHRHRPKLFCRSSTTGHVYGRVLSTSTNSHGVNNVTGEFSR